MTRRLVVRTTTLAVLCVAALASPQARPDLQILHLSPTTENAKGTAERKGVAPPRRLDRRGLLRLSGPSLGQSLPGDTEPNGTAATATPLAGTNVVALGNLFPNGDVDFYSFVASAGDRVYAATMTSFSASSFDSQLTLLATDGVTVIEFDDDNGSFTGLSSSIAGATISTSGTYYLKVNDFTASTGSERPYELHFRLQSGTPTPEVEPNDTPATAMPLPAGGWVSGTRDPALATEQDWYGVTLAAGDRVYLALDLDPERDGVTWNGRLGLGLFGDASNQILVVDDAGAAETPNPARPSEAFFLSVKAAGTYYVFVDSASAAVGGPTATYHLSASVLPALTEGINCTTYTSTDVPKTIGPGTGLVSSTITVPGNPRIADLDVEIVLDHTLMADIDAHLRSPAGNDNGLFTDIGAAATGGQTQADIVLDDEASATPSFTALKGLRIKPERAYRLGWFDGENTGGTWTLDLRDDTANASGGTLSSWSLRVCEPAPPPSCAAGTVATTVYSSDFEGGAGGFTHSGAADEWALGLPATAATITTIPVAAFTTCNSGTSCWKTDLTGTYNASSSQDLLSPNIDLRGLVTPVIVSWAQRYQLESASYDHASVDHQQVGGATPVRLFEWLDATMTNAPGNPVVNVGESAGWGLSSRRSDSLAGLNTELRFHLDSDTTVNFGGWAIDDVSVTACRPLSADLSVTNTDGVATATAGGNVTYTITAANAGPDGVSGGTVADAFPAALGCSWTCVAAGGGTCSAAGAGSIGDTVDLPAGGSLVYTATCTIASSASGSLASTASVSGGAVADPNAGDNSATDTDTLTSLADLSLAKTGPAFAQRDAELSYTIVVTNAGPSDAASVQIADATPAGLAFVSNSGDCATAFPCMLGALAAGASRTITSAFSVPSGHPVATPIANTATVSSGTPDPDTANDASTVTSRFGAFYALAPCRLVDTRDPAWVPALAPSEQRTFTLAGACGVPAGAVALSVNLAVTSAVAAGHLRVFPAGGAVPLTSAINFSAGQTRANNAIVQTSSDGSVRLDVFNNSTGTVDFILDVNGYFE